VLQSTSQALLIASSRHSPAGLAGQRVSDAERADVTDELSRHFTEGRLDEEEFGHRLDAAMHAVTYRDLAGLLQDLPPAGDPPRPLAPPVAARPARRRRRAGLTDLMLLVLIAVVLVAAAHAISWIAAPVLWTAILAAIVVVALRRPRRRR
jgi:ferric-dicitrate binding protein FerR (iron transport regulator)